MSFIQNFYTSRDNKTDGNTYVGQQDRLWYNPSTNSIYVNTANIAGGTPVSLATGANIIANNITVNTITSTGGNVAVTGNLVISGNISPAATGKIGGITPGPGVFISNQGELTIDSANLPVSFGNFTANNNILSIVNINEDMILQTEGDAEIQLIGNIGFYKPDGIPPNISNRFAFFNKDGQATFYIPESDPSEGALKLIGSTGGNFTPPLNTGVMLQITGQNNDVSRLYNDSIGNFSAFVGRRLNGNVTFPTPVLDNQELMRITATAHNGTAFPTGAGQRITYRALGNQSVTNGGGAIEFWTTPLNSTTIGQIATIDTANGVSATKFTGNLTGNVTGTATTATNLAAATGILAGTISIDPASVTGGASATQTFTLTGLTTNHKIVITSGTAFNSGLIIQAAWASALNTISIEFRNTTNQAIDAGAHTIQYFAWV